MVHGVDEFVLVVDEDVLPDGIICLNEVQVHPVEEVLAALEQGVGLGQERPHQLTGGGIAGVDDKGQLLDLFALPAFQRFDERQVAVDRKAVGVEIQVELVRVQFHFLAQDAEPAQEIFVAAAAAVGGLYLLLQRVGTVARFLVPQVQLGLHPFTDLLPRFLRQGRGHLLGLFGCVLRPQAVVVGGKLPFQLAQHTGRLAGEPTVHRGGGHHGFFGGDLLVGVLAHIGQGTLHAGAVQIINHILHRDVAGKVPQLRLPAAFQPQMPKYAVEYHVQIQPVEILRVLLIEL